MQGLITEEDLRNIAKQRREEEASGSTHALAGIYNVSHQFLARFIRGDVHPGPKIAKALGFEQVICFRKIEPKGKPKKAKK